MPHIFRTSRRGKLATRCRVPLPFGGLSTDLKFHPLKQQNGRHSPKAQKWIQFCWVPSRQVGSSRRWDVEREKEQSPTNLLQNEWTVFLSRTNELRMLSYRFLMFFLKVDTIMLKRKSVKYLRLCQTQNNNSGACRKNNSNLGETERESICNTVQRITINTPWFIKKDVILILLLSKTWVKNHKYIVANKISLM